MPEGSLPSSVGSLVCLPYLWTFAVAFILKDTWCLLPTTSDLGLNKHFLSILLPSRNWQHNSNVLKNSTISSPMWQPKEHYKSYTITDQFGFGSQFGSQLGFAFVCRLFLQQKKEKYSNLHQKNLFCNFYKFFCWKKKI